MFHFKLSTSLFHHSQQPHAAVICRSQNNVGFFDDIFSFEKM